MSTGSIYSLSSSESPDNIKYIGLTRGTLESRLKNHISKMKYENTYKSNWIKSCKNKKYKILIELVDEVPLSEISFWEQHYISLYKSWGFKLTNLTEGGEIGIYLNKVSRDKISNSMKEYFKTVPPEQTKLRVKRMLENRTYEAQYKKMSLYDKKTKEFIKEYVNKKELCDKLGLNIKKVSDTTYNVKKDGKIRWAHKGYIFITEKDTIEKYLKRKSKYNVSVLKRRELSKQQTVEKNITIPRRKVITIEERNKSWKENSTKATQTLRDSGKYTLNVYDKDDNYIDTYPLPADAAKGLNIKVKGICKVLGGYKNTYKGYKFKYANTMFTYT